MPASQVVLLMLWDEIRLPHEERKQVSGDVLPCLGFEVDPNAMTVFMSLEKRMSLVKACELFTVPGQHKTVHNFWKI